MTARLFYKCVTPFRVSVHFRLANLTQMASTQIKVHKTLKFLNFRANLSLNNNLQILRQSLKRYKSPNEPCFKKKFDKDGNGTLDKDELRSLLEETLKRKITDKMMDSYVELQFSAEDKNSNRLIELDEFISLYSKIYLDPEVLLEISKY